jgi:hypothetical protein
MAEYIVVLLLHEAEEALGRTGGPNEVVDML